MYSFLSQLVYWALPNHCVLCGLRLASSHKMSICKPCTADLPWVKNVCQYCGLPLHLNESFSICGLCLQNKPAHQMLRTLFFYQFPIDQFILRLKFQEQLLYAKLLGELLAIQCHEYYQQQTQYPGLIIPVPLHKKRLKQRGFNQAIEIARPVSKILSVPLGFKMVHRVRYTEAQMDLPLSLRAKNVKKAFSASQKLSGQHVMIIDDVITSGHTVAALTSILQQAGVKRIDIWGIARALRAHNEE